MKDLKQEFNRLRKEQINFIAVSNAEWYSLLKDEIRNSIAIEGVFANRNELLDVLERKKRTNDEKTAAILGYYESASTCYEYANNLYKENEFQLRLSDLRQIHTLLMRYEKQAGTYDGDLGDFRKEDVAVTQSSFTPLKGEFVHETMQKYVEWINHHLTLDEPDCVRFVAAAHVLFETIHPFNNDNGRVGRILLSYLLIGCGYVNIAIKGTNKPEREKYYAALEIGDNCFNAMLREIESGALPGIELIDACLDKSELSNMEAIIRERLSNSFDRLKRKELQAFNRDAELPLRDAALFFEYSPDYLRQLIHDGKIKASKKGKLWYVTIREVEKYMSRQETLFE